MLPDDLTHLLLQLVSVPGHGKFGETVKPTNDKF